MKKVILNIHGFNSGPGEKVTELTIQFPDSVIIQAPQLSYIPEEAIAQLREILDQYRGQEVHVIGTSLGGFYAMYLSTLYRTEMMYYFYIINPSFTPHLTLARYLGETVINYKTPEQFKVTHKFLNQLNTLYQAMTQNYTTQCIYSSSFFLSTQDELLNFTEITAFIKGFKVPYRLTPSQQGHRFQDISPVIQAIKENMIG